MSKPDDIPQDVLDNSAHINDCLWAVALTQEEHDQDTQTIARAILAAEKRGEERERAACAQVASGNAAGERELERLAHQAGDDRDALIHSLLASENEQLAAAIRKRGEG